MRLEWEDDDSNKASASTQHALVLRRTVARPVEISSAANGPIAKVSSLKAWRKLVRACAALTRSHSIDATRARGTGAPKARHR